MKTILSKRYSWRGLITLAVVTVLVIGYLIWPIGRALSVAHPRRVAVRYVTPSDFELSYENRLNAEKWEEKHQPPPY